MAVITAATATCVSNLVPNPKESTAYFLVATEPARKSQSELGDPIVSERKPEIWFLYR